MNMRILAAVSALALSACAVGPDYVAPIPSAPAAGAFVTPAGQAISAAAAVEGDWWRLYRDQTLHTLVADALRANTDVRVAVARLDRARASLREVRADRTPQIGVGGSAQYGRLPAGQRLGGDRENWYVDAGLDVAYEVDLFGRVTRNIEAARGDVQAATADMEAVRVAVAAETTRAYADAVSSAERITVAERIVALLDQSLTLMRKREGAGLATPLDSARIEALRNQRQADIPSLQAERQSALFRLATLTGRAPAELPPAAGARQTSLVLNQPIPVGDGAALLARRPDVRAAERRLAAATARIGVATADLYPRVTLGGSVGSTGAGFGNLFGANPLTWLLGPLINWSVNQAPARARVAGAEADSRVALAQFDGTVLTALEETETALTNYQRMLERRSALAAARDAAQTAARINRARQREGQIDSLELLDAERTLADAEAQLATADAMISRAQVDLFRALGGGWQTAQDQARS
ncbi:TolC family protein [Sphingomonas sp. ID1715]|uniref:efflux transporter outer membrane subunit n=1 Tax=Sphingomonas sp. ID1715 TaxID=1656898 RepID=UPI001487B325|nr:TolC family protein [Sphingomonas sp. ID1715]NNM76134.1 TolC family protein [Sphingomonas sp. ID1715]